MSSYCFPVSVLHRSFHLLAVVVTLAVVTDVEAVSPELEGIACRSVHLQYQAPKGLAFYNEVTVEESHEGTYFCVCGFNMGYYGIQELQRGKKLLIFSVWDPGNQNDPDSVDVEDRVKLLHQNVDVRIGRFGNEGTGGQSFYDYDWKVGETYRFMVTAEVRGARTAFASHFFHPEKKAWIHLVTFERNSNGAPLSGYYAFVEDFRRNRISATKNRRAQFTQPWVKGLSGKWQPVTQARFTADGNPVMNIDAGPEPEGFFLSTGGKIENEHTPLRDLMKIQPGPRPMALQKLP